jgi:ribose 5-phosphate isomerase B
VRIAIGADHAGFALKEHLKQTLARLGHAVDDHGTHSEVSVDYPPICIRAALCHDLYSARLSREHNNANVLSMGGRIVAFGLADEILALWLETAFEGGRHQRRIDLIGEAERHP